MRKSRIAECVERIHNEFVNGICSESKGVDILLDTTVKPTDTEDSKVSQDTKITQTETCNAECCTARVDGVTDAAKSLVQGLAHGIRTLAETVYKKFHTGGFTDFICRFSPCHSDGRYVFGGLAQMFYRINM